MSTSSELKTRTMKLLCWEEALEVTPRASSKNRIMSPEIYQAHNARCIENEVGLAA
ncbi:hypothetical protein HOLleu_43919 [Holothuria leucospilota]|uniref:Uncharacterized protein n=1 Tax=Holothuria leucospilota TaxID=206669 RepID=A0A9Q1B8V1_HOLLE|nr:hypothetical protein HOLleu_43919 [Holothuria leucospilota]